MKVSKAFSIILSLIAFYFPVLCVFVCVFLHVCEYVYETFLSNPKVVFRNDYHLMEAGLKELKRVELLEWGHES
jgi:hypothetical protein